MDRRVFDLPKNDTFNQGYRGGIKKYFYNIF
jgi:hypothetical protein